MRPHRLVTLAITIAVTITLANPGLAPAMWTSVSEDMFQTEHVCRDGLTIDLASTLDGPRSVHVWVADQSNPPGQWFFHTSFLIPAHLTTNNTQQMRDMTLFSAKSLGRLNKVIWGPLRNPAVGSQIRVAVESTDTFYTRTVESCSVNGRRDLFTTGYVWQHREPWTWPAAVPYPFTPDQYWSYNSTGQANSITRTGRGVYTVQFPGLGSPGGNAQVTTYGTTPSFCKIASTRWASAGSLLRLNVRCFDPGTGGPADGEFLASYTSGGGTANTYAFALVDQPSGDGRSPANPSYQYNNRGGPIMVDHSPKVPGRYTVTIPTIYAVSPGGTAKVTAVGDTAADCRLVWFGPAQASQIAVVQCYTGTGQAADQQFTIAYMDHMNVIGDNMMSYAYALVDEPWRQDRGYTTNPAYQFSRAMDRTGSVRIGARDYDDSPFDVLLPYQRGGFSPQGQSWDGGTVHVTAYGNGTTRCQLGGWSDGGDEIWGSMPGEVPQVGRVATVICFDAKGARAGSAFTLQYTGQIQ
ncbi:hypothetical protein [Actinophytocola sp.]|uniref:hypothetical protein n=1 Tax=Actinophytocola sp. TaxID=1872138 RepID=UPI002D803D3F|nr:hypothetical protein [Actinophytocola sp.]HET9141237.1 hypothetical protein [Actinophytocola sp.]